MSYVLDVDVSLQQFLCSDQLRDSLLCCLLLCFPIQFKTASKLMRLFVTPEEAVTSEMYAVAVVFPCFFSRDDAGHIMLFASVCAGMLDSNPLAHCTPLLWRSKSGWCFHSFT